MKEKENEASRNEKERKGRKKQRKKKKENGTFMCNFCSRIMAKERGGEGERERDEIDNVIIERALG